MKFEIPDPDNTPTWAKSLFPELVKSINSSIDDKITKLEAHFNKSIKSADERIDDVVERVVKAEQCIDHLTSKLEHAKFIIKKCQDENVTLKQRAINSENYSRRNNLVFSGKGIKQLDPVSDNQNDGANHTLEVVKKIMIHRMNIDAERVNGMQIVRCHELVSSNLLRSIIIRFEHFQDRQFVWSKRSNLSKSDIYVSENFAFETENKRKHLYPIAAKAKKMPQYHKKVNITLDKLCIDNKWYTEETLCNLPSDLSILSTCEKRDDKVVVFGGSNSQYHPLSNFKYKKFNCYEQSYTSVEQGYAHRKAIENGDVMSARNIMFTSNPHECKRLGRKVSPFDGKMWEEKKNGIMADLVTASILQNTETKKFLMNTEDRYIIEANARDTHFASGYAFTDRRNMDPVNLLGKNELGEILMAIRQNNV